MSSGYLLIGSDDVGADSVTVFEQSCRFEVYVWHAASETEITFQVGGPENLRALADRLHEIASYFDGGPDGFASAWKRP